MRIDFDEATFRLAGSWWTIISLVNFSLTVQIGTRRVDSLTSMAMGLIYCDA